MSNAMRLDAPPFWRNVMLFVAVGKAAIAGAGAALALLGVVDLAAAIGAKDIIEALPFDNVLDVFAMGGGVIGALVKLVWSVATR